MTVISIEKQNQQALGRDRERWEDRLGTLGAEGDCDAQGCPLGGKPGATNHSQGAKIAKGMPLG